MSRRARIKSKSKIYHVMARGNNKADIFHDKDDRHYFIEILNRVGHDYNFYLYAYCLMDNHYHLVIQENKQPISTIMKRINLIYVIYYNKKYGRTGHLFHDRFKSEPVEDDVYLKIVIRYVHNNPVAARLVKKPESYKWSSYKNYIDNNLQQKITLEINAILHLFAATYKGALAKFISFSNKDNDTVCLELDDEPKKDQLIIDNAKRLVQHFYQTTTINKNIMTSHEYNILKKILKKELYEKRMPQLSITQVALLLYGQQDTIIQY